MRATGGAGETAVRNGILAGGDYATSARLLVKNAAGTWVDLTDLYGRDFLVGWNVSEAVDEPLGTATFELRREIDRYSLAPLVEGSRINRTGGTPGGAVAPLLKSNREVKLQTSVDAFGAAPSNWRTLFHGRIVSFDTASDPFTLTCQDLGGSLVRRKLKRDRWYGLTHPNADSGCGTWSPGTPFAVGDRIIPATPVDALAPRSYRCTTAGTTHGATEPTWPTSGTVADGSVVWTAESATSKTTLTAAEIVMQAILNDAFRGESVPTLYTPTASTWGLRAYEQSRDGVLEALNNLAAQIGWSVRYVYDGATDAFRLTFQAPDRAKTVADAVWSDDSPAALTEVSTGVENVRNWIRVVGYDRGVLTADGQPTRVEVEAKDAASIAEYGEAFAEISHTATAQIDTKAELQALADRVLADLAQPILSHSATVPFFPWAQLGDLYNFPPDGLRYDSVQSLAVVGIQHACREGMATTSLQCRANKPVAGGTNFWHGRFANVRPIKIGNGQTIAQAVTQTSTTVSHLLGGGTIKIREVNSLAVIEGYELHISTTAGFTPSSATLQSRGPAYDRPVSGLIPGGTYYGRVIPYGRAVQSKGITYGKPLPQFSFVAGTAGSSMIDDGAIIEAKLANRAVSSIKIGVGAVTSGELGDSAVTSGKILDGAVLTSKIGVSAVIPSKLDAGPPIMIWDDARGYLLDPRILAVNQGSKAAVEALKFFVTLNVTSGATDFYFTTDLQCHSSRGNTVLLTYRCNGSGWKSGDTLRVYNAANLSESATAVMIADGAWHTASFDLSAFVTTGTLRVDVQDSGVAIGSGSTFDVAYLGFGALGGGGVAGPVSFKQGTVSIAQPGWTGVTFQNSFSNYPGFAGVSYRKDSSGYVQLRGLAQRTSAALNTTIFALPTGLVPATSKIFSVIAGNSWARLNVAASTGTVQIEVAGSSTWYQFISFDGVAFSLD